MILNIQTNRPCCFMVKIDLFMTKSAPNIHKPVVDGNVDSFAFYFADCLKLLLNLCNIWMET